MSTKTFKAASGQNYTVKFGWIEIGQCRREMIHPVLRSHDLQEMMEKIESAPEGERDVLTKEQKEIILETGFETLDSMFRIAQIGLMAAQKDLSESEAVDILDSDPNLIAQIFHFFKQRNWLYQAQASYNPEEEDKKTKKKASSASASR